jgi:hypothetical protein
MSSRFLTNAALALAGGFVAIARFAFTPAVTAWLAFALGIAAIVMAALSQLDRSRGQVQRILDGIIVALGVLTIGFSLAFTGTVVAWLSFAEALGFVMLAYVGLTLHEVAHWRAQRGLTPLHNLEVLGEAEQHRRAA